MSPTRIRGTGSYRFKIDWTAKLGFRIDRSAETTVKREYDALVAVLYELRANGQIESSAGSLLASYRSPHSSTQNGSGD